MPCVRGKKAERNSMTWLVDRQERRLLLDNESEGGWGFYEDVDFEIRAMENSEIITLTKETFDNVSIAICALNSRY